MEKVAKLIFSLILVYSLSACTFGKRIEISEPVTTLANETCMDSFDNFAFSTPNIDGPRQEIFLPGKPWHVVSTLPQEIQGDGYEIAAIRSTESEVEIWAQPYHPGGLYSADDPGIYDYWVFGINSKIWRRVPSQVEGSDMFVDQLFVTKDGSIWGRNVWEKTASLNGSSVLSRYNEMIKRFESVSYTSQIPNGVIDTHQNATHWPNWDAILLDSHDTFWFFVYQDGIYSYDPFTSMVRHPASLSNFPKIAQVSLAMDGNFFFRIETNEYTLQDGQIYQYIPTTGEIKPVVPPQGPWPAVNSILADHQGRLWTGVFGWQESNGEWRSLHPEMEEFLQLNQNLPLWRYYQPPTVFFESSDDRVWFNIPRSEEWKTLRSGIAWYDPETNTGCWFTTEGFNVVEDSNKTIWLIADEKLYRYIIDSSTR